MYSLPPSVTGIVLLDALNQPKSKGPAGASYGGLSLGGESPIKQYLPYLNLGLCGVLVVAGMVVRMKRDVIWVGFGNIPAAVYLIVLLVKSVMGSVDVGELEGLKYGYKGA